jgi:hypothetical protein
VESQEADFQRGIWTWARHLWFRRKAQAVSIESLLYVAVALRDSFHSEFQGLMSRLDGSDVFYRKRLLPKLRYYASRLVYLAPDDVLIKLARMAQSCPELCLHSRIMEAVSTGNVDSILEMGTNATQACAQPLRAAQKKIHFDNFADTAPQTLSLAVFRLNGIDDESARAADEQSNEILKFASSGADNALMKSKSPFVRELACLHGISLNVRHPDILQTAFDQDEELQMDTITQTEQYLES